MSPNGSHGTSLSEYIFTDPDSIERQLRKKARAMFAAERDDILSQLPVHHRQCFNSVMFWMKKHPMPVLIVNPYESVPPGPIRAGWVARFLQERKKNDGFKSLPLLAFRYGVLSSSVAAHSSVENAFILIDPSQNQLIPYKEGIQKGYDQIPRDIQKKILLQQPLDDDDQLMLNALKEMHKDAHEKTGGYSYFEEGYNLIHCKPDAVGINLLSTVKPPIGIKQVNVASSPTTSMASDDLAKVKVGTRIGVFWPDDNKYYPAQVTKVKGDFYYCVYDDGNEEWLPLADQKFVFERASRGNKEANQEPNNTQESEGLEKDEEGVDENDKNKMKTGNRCHKKARKEKSPRRQSSTGQSEAHRCIRPKKMQRKSDGSPRGRPPRATSLDAQTGLFVPNESKADRESLLKANPAAVSVAVGTDSSSYHGFPMPIGYSHVDV